MGLFAPTQSELDCASMQLIMTSMDAFGIALWLGATTCRKGAAPPEEAISAAAHLIPKDARAVTYPPWRHAALALGLPRGALRQQALRAARRVTFFCHPLGLWGGFGRETGRV